MRGNAVNQKDHSILEQKESGRLCCPNALFYRRENQVFRRSKVSHSWFVVGLKMDSSSITITIFFSCLLPLHKTVFMKNTIGSPFLGTVFSKSILINLTESKCKSVYKREWVSFLSHTGMAHESHVTRQKAKNSFLHISRE